MTELTDWIWGICCTQARKHASEGIQPDFEPQGKRHQKSKTGVSMATQKGLVSSKNYEKKDWTDSKWAR